MSYRIDSETAERRKILVAFFLTATLCLGFALFVLLKENSADQANRLAHIAAREEEQGRLSKAYDFYIRAVQVAPDSKEHWLALDKFVRENPEFPPVPQRIVKEL